MEIQILAAGVPQGSGPIATARNWRQNQPLDRVGSFSFECSASDPQAAQLLARREVRCVREGVTVGAGLVDVIESTLDSNGVSMLRISGQDLAQELTLATVGSVALRKPGWATATGVSQVTINPDTGAGTGQYDAPEAHDGSLVTHWRADFVDTNRWLYVGGATPFLTMKFDCQIDPVGGYGGGVFEGLQYFDGVGWYACTITSDTTIVAGNSFAQDGTITFTLSGGLGVMKQTTENGVAGYFVRGGFPVAGDGIEFFEVWTWGYLPTDAALSTLAALLPSPWVLGSSPGQAATTKTDVYLLYNGESVFEALSKLAELCGEHFYTTSARKAVWIGTTQASSGVRAIVPPVARLTETDPLICYIDNLVYKSESSDMISWVYPEGAGTGDGMLTLAQRTKGDPAGYVVNPTANYVRTATDLGYGKRRVPFKSIGTDAADQRSRENAANALLDAAVAYLARRKQAVVTYGLSVRKLAHGAVLPGSKIWVDVQRWYGGISTFSVNDPNLIVLEIEETQAELSQATRLTVCTVAQWPVTDTELLAREYQTVRDMGRLSQPVGIADVRSSSFASTGMGATFGAGGIVNGGSSAASGGGVGGLAAHQLTGGYHTETGLTAGRYLRAETATSFVWAPIATADLPAGMAGAGLGYAAGVLSVNAGAGLGISGDDVILAASAAGAGLGYAAGVLSVNAGAGLAISGDDVVLPTPGSATATSTNSATAPHTHAITNTAVGAASTIMATNASGGFTFADGAGFGFADALLTRPVANTLGLATGKGIQSNYTSGWTGSGWRLDQGQSYASQSFLEIDRLSVRGVMNVYELLIHQIRATNGSIFVANTGKAKSLYDYLNGWYDITTEANHGFAAGDLIRAQRFTGNGVYQCDMTVDSSLGLTEFRAVLRATYTAPAVGMEFVRLGNTTDADRQGSIYMTADDTNAPYINILSGVAAFTDWGTTGKTKARIGNMNGSYGIAANYFGIGLGDYAAGAGNFLRYDQSGGFLLQAGAGGVAIDGNGLALNITTTYQSARGITYKSSGVETADISAYADTGISVFRIRQSPVNVSHTFHVTSYASATYPSTMVLAVASGSQYGGIEIQRDSDGSATSNYVKVYGAGLSLGYSTTPSATEGTMHLPSAGYIGLGASAARLEFNSGAIHTHSATFTVNGTNAWNSATPNATIADDAGRTLAIWGESLARYDYDNDDAAIVVNRVGYNGGATRFRDVEIMDGKGARVALFDGSVNQLILPGGLNVGSATGAGAGDINASGHIHVGDPNNYWGSFGAAQDTGDIAVTKLIYFKVNNVGYYLFAIAA